MPANPIAGVILITGSGPQDRNQLFMGHQTFLVLADYLTRKNIAVLRYDDRGVGQSQGQFDGATSYDFADDASSAIDFLNAQPELHNRLVGIIGHSEGGLIAPIVATQNSKVDFITLLAGPSRSGRFVSENQIKKILLSNGMSKDTSTKGSQITKSLNKSVIQYADLSKDDLKQKLKTVYQTKWQQLDDTSQTQLQRLGGGSLPEPRLKMLVGDWYKAFLTHQPVDYLTKLNIPTLALYGDKDVQVSAEDHAKVMEHALTENGVNLSKVVILPNHNHMFQRSKTGAMTEYQHIEETLSLLTLSSIADWISDLK
ncbi:alpha/beta fold hydrolase [Thalassotalea nanhaiensis]|uniref:Alpha/beta fold hydrolase n=1 Tax=Thalassotalea nanhaiensis TaxID=3065648 RepID=A0ABY9TLN5_9GAMM|nr:alpha/beta fold hydrolase [Colwelliaceae bacterium SQ345]